MPEPETYLTEAVANLPTELTDTQRKLAVAVLEGVDVLLRERELRIQKYFEQRGEWGRKKLHGILVWIASQIQK